MKLGHGWLTTAYCNSWLSEIYPMGASLGEFENKAWKDKYQDMLFENGIIDISSEMIHQCTSGLTLETGFSVKIIAF